MKFIVFIKKHNNIKLMTIEHYGKNILHKEKYSYMLNDLFDLDDSDKGEYGDFFTELIEILKTREAKQ